MTTVTYFTAKWCSGCKTTTTICNRLSKERTDIDLIVHDVDTADGSAAAYKHSVSSLPALFITGVGGTKSFIGNHVGYDIINAAIDSVSTIGQE